MHDEPVGVAHQDLRYVVAVECLVLEDVGCAAVLEVLAEKTEDAGLLQLGVFEHATDLSRDLFVGGELPCGGGLEQLGIRARVGQGVGEGVGDFTGS